MSSQKYLGANCPVGEFGGKCLGGERPWGKLPEELASCLIYARVLLEYVIFIWWLRSVIKMLPSVKSAEDKVLTFLILREKC